METLLGVLIGPLLLVGIAVIVIAAYLRERRDQSTKPARTRGKHIARAPKEQMASERPQSKDNAYDDPYEDAGDDGAESARGGRSGSDAAAAAFVGGALMAHAMGSDDGDSGDSGDGGD
jgi:hypothetical protein